MNKKTVIFWGTGSAGLNMLDFWRTEGFSPDFFTSNDSGLWGTDIKGIKIISPNQIKELARIEVYVTCTAYDAVYSQLITMGIDGRNIINATYCSSPSHVNHNKALFCSITNTEYPVNFNRIRGCYADLSHGIVLGGVESWVYQLAQKYSEHKIKGEILIPNDVPFKDIGLPFQIKQLSKDSCTSTFKSAYKHLLAGEYSTFISNFPNEIFLAACFAKRILKNKVKHVAVIHSDLDMYYQIYSGFSDDIDECYVISIHIKNKLEQYGFPKDKIKMLYWIVDFNLDKNNRKNENNNQIKIGYVGRLNREQKRVELIPEISKRLKELNVNYSIEIAGSGEQEEYLKQKIKEYEIDDNVRMIGVLASTQIQNFWKNKDIYLSCSDYEGHSISQCEAMACGVTPVVTDVSGAADDIKNGVNGYIVSLDNRVKEIVQVITYLYKHKEKLVDIHNYNKNFMLKRNASCNSYLELLF